MAETRTVLTLHKADRRIVIDLGDDAETDERRSIHSIVNGALDVLAGKKRSVVDPERFAVMRTVPLHVMRSSWPS